MTNESLDRKILDASLKLKDAGYEPSVHENILHGWGPSKISNLIRKKIADLDEKGQHKALDEILQEDFANYEYFNEEDLMNLINSTVERIMESKDQAKRKIIRF